MTTIKTLQSEYSIESRRELVPGVVNDIMEYLKANTPIASCDCFFDIKVVLSELISNAVIHGNGEKSLKPVDITVFNNNKSIEFLIVDRGVEFTPENKEEEKLLCESSRGISICHILCKKLIYSFIEGKGNSARAVFILK